MQLSLDGVSPQRNTAAAVRVFQVSAMACRASVLKMLRMYKRWVSPLLPSACRFHPTCSEYTLDAVQKYGVLRGLGMGLRRLLRCHPFHQGGFDPVR